MTTSQDQYNPGTEVIEGTLESSSLTETTYEEDTNELYLNMEPLARLAEGKTVRIPKNPHFTRKDVVQAFQSAFDLVGGVPRLALWANENYTEFAKLYARLLPSQASSALGESNRMQIEVLVPASKLDES